MQDLAKETGMVLIVPIFEKEDDGFFYNTAAIVDADGTYPVESIPELLTKASEADMVKKFRVALALQPVATALFANSPFFEGKLNGHKSWRSRIWRDLDSARTGMLPFVFEALW